MMVISGSGTNLVDISNWSLFFRADLPAAILIPPLSSNIEVGTGASSCWSTSSMLMFQDCCCNPSNLENMKFESHTLVDPTLTTFLFAAIVITRHDSESYEPAGQLFSNDGICESQTSTDLSTFTLLVVNLRVTIFTMSSGSSPREIGSIHNWSLSIIFLLSSASEAIRDGASSLWRVTATSIFPSSMSAAPWTSWLHVCILTCSHSPSRSARTKSSL